MFRLEALLKKEERKKSMSRPRMNSQRFIKLLGQEADRRREELMKCLRREKDEGRWLLTLIKKYGGMLHLLCNEETLLL